MDHSANGTGSTSWSAPLHSLQEWHTVWQSVTDFHSLQQTNASLAAVLEQRYGAEDRAVLDDRVTLYKAAIGTLRSTPALAFNLTTPLAVIASPGRDRLMMGHTDFGGLGGFTVDCATREELVCFAQCSGDGTIHVTNSDNQSFPSTLIDPASLSRIANDSGAYGKANWSTNDWVSYIRAALTYMMSDRFTDSSDAISVLSGGVRFYIVSDGLLKLPHTGGLSSSAALTGAISMAVSRLCSRPFTLPSLASVDYGEYYLGKFAGCADKMAQLFAHRNTVSVIQSKPEKFVQSLKFPTQEISIVIAESDMPRLTLPQARLWLTDRRGLPVEHAERVIEHAHSVMVRFGSVVYVKAVTALVEALYDAKVYAAAGLTAREANALRRSLLGDRINGESDNETEVPTEPLLRELCAGGLLESWLPELAGWSQRHVRYRLLYKAFRLIPTSCNHIHNGNDYQLFPRKAALYGVSEVERGAAYLRALEAVSAASDVSDRMAVEKAVNEVIELVSLCHDGDRAVVDYRKLTTDNTALPAYLSRHDAGFAPSPWASNENVSITDATLDSWLASSAELVSCVGSYERSVVDVDELTDQIRAQFNGAAAARVSAAGLGGRVCIHCRASIREELQSWLESRSWRCRQPKPGAPTEPVGLAL